jgi:hypothetical protein
VDGPMMCRCSITAFQRHQVFYPGSAVTCACRARLAGPSSRSREGQGSPRTNRASLPGFGTPARPTGVERSRAGVAIVLSMCGVLAAKLRSGAVGRGNHLHDHCRWRAGPAPPPGGPGRSGTTRRRRTGPCVPWWPMTSPSAARWQWRLLKGQGLRCARVRRGSGRGGLARGTLRLILNRSSMPDRTHRGHGGHPCRRAGQRRHCAIFGMSAGGCRGADAGQAAGWRLSAQASRQRPPAQTVRAQGRQRRAAFDLDAPGRWWNGDRDFLRELAELFLSRHLPRGPCTRP